LPHRIILDTDIGTDVDDALALAFALRHPEIDLAAVTTVSGDTRLRGQIAAHLLALAGRSDIEVAAGVREPLLRQGPIAGMFWAGHEGQGLLEEGEELALSPRHGVDLLVEWLRAEEMEVVTVGPQSNLAAALIKEPAIAGRISHLTVMGGFFHACELEGHVVPPTVDYNLNADAGAAVRALSAPIPTTFVPADVTMRAWFLEKDLSRLEESKDPLSQALVRLVRVWMPLQRRLLEFLGVPAQTAPAAILHDPLAVATIVDRRFVKTKRLKMTVAIVDGHARTFIDPAAGREVEVVTDVDARAFAEFWLETVLGV
jgi:inosine-uridine nucleoside N-ribohydrolase